MRETRHYRYAILCAAVFWLAWWAFDGWMNPGRAMQWLDNREFQALAVSLLHGQGFTVNGVDPYSFRVPGWPLVMALGYGVCGSTEPHIASLLAVLCHLGAVAIVAWRWRLAGALVWLPVALIGFDPGAIYFNGLPLADPLFTLLAVAGVALWAKHPRWGALLLGLTPLVRPVGWYLVVAAAVLILVERRKKQCGAIG